MRSRAISARVPRPRNPVVLALVRRIAGLAGGRHRNARKATRQQAELDLAQRVRESGEW